MNIIGYKPHTSWAGGRVFRVYKNVYELNGNTRCEYAYVYSEKRNVLIRSANLDASNPNFNIYKDKNYNYYNLNDNQLERIDDLIISNCDLAATIIQSEKLLNTKLKQYE
jgi:hypothetical protein